MGRLIRSDGVLVADLGNWDTEAEILIPLTSSLYVPGKLADRQKVIVDIGTGFYVEKVTSSPFLPTAYSHCPSLGFGRNSVL